MKGRDALGLVAVGAILALAGAKVVDGFPRFVGEKELTCAIGGKQVCKGQPATEIDRLNTLEPKFNLSYVRCLGPDDFGGRLYGPVEALERRCETGAYTVGMNAQRGHAYYMIDVRNGRIAKILRADDREPTWP